MKAAVLLLAATVLAGSSPASAQSPTPAPVGAPGNPEVTSPAAEAAPSTKATPGELLEKSARDAANGDVRAALKDDATALRRGPLLLHGNYCGVGNRPGTPPVDLLDAACMRHDACTRTNTLPTCACNDRLRGEATAIAQDPRTPADLQLTATAIATSMAVLVCK